MSFKHKSWCETTCDRCGKKVDGDPIEADTSDWTRFEIVPHGNGSADGFKRFAPAKDRRPGRDPLEGKENVGVGSAQIDLCKPCAEKFLKFLNDK